jgi:hypothetical protein
MLREACRQFWQAARWQQRARFSRWFGKRPLWFAPSPQSPQFGGGSIADLVISLWTSSDDGENDDRSQAKEMPLFRDEKLGEPRNLFS